MAQRMELYAGVTGEHAGVAPLPLSAGAAPSSRRSTLSVLSVEPPLEVREGRRSSTASSRAARPWVPSPRGRGAAAVAAAAQATSRSASLYSTTTSNQSARDIYGLPDMSDEEERVTNRVLVAPLLGDLLAAVAASRSHSQAASPTASVSTRASGRRSSRHEVGIQLDYEDSALRPRLDVGGSGSSPEDGGAETPVLAPAARQQQQSEVAVALAKAVTAPRPLNIAPLVSTRAPSQQHPAAGLPQGEAALPPPPAPPPRRSRSHSPRASPRSPTRGSPDVASRRRGPHSPTRVGSASPPRASPSRSRHHASPRLTTREEEMWSPIPLVPAEGGQPHLQRLSLPVEVVASPPASHTTAGLHFSSPSLQALADADDALGYSLRASPTAGVEGSRPASPSKSAAGAPRTRSDAAVQTGEGLGSAGDSPPPVSVISEPGGWGLPPLPSLKTGTAAATPRHWWHGSDGGSLFPAGGVGSGGDFLVPGASVDASSGVGVGGPVSPLSPRIRAASSASSVISVGSARSHSTRRTDGSFSLRRRRSGTAGSVGGGGGRTPSRAMSEAGGGTSRRPGVEDSTLLQSVRDSFGIIEQMLSEQLGETQQPGAAPHGSSVSAPPTPAGTGAAGGNAPAAGGSAAVAGAFDEFFAAAGGEASGQGTRPSQAAAALPERDPLDGFDINAIPLGPDGEPQLDLVMTVLEALVDEREEWKKRHEGQSAASPAARARSAPPSPPSAKAASPLGLSMMTTRASPPGPHPPPRYDATPSSHAPGSGESDGDESEARTVIRMMDAVMSGSGSEDAGAGGRGGVHEEQSGGQRAARRPSSRARRSRGQPPRMDGDSPDSGSRGGVPWYRRPESESRSRWWRPGGGYDDDAGLGYDDEVAPYDEEGFEAGLNGGRARAGSSASRAGSRGRGGIGSGGIGPRGFYDEDEEEENEEDEEEGASFYDDPRFTSVEQTRLEANEVLQLAEKLDQLVTAMVGPSTAGGGTGSRGRARGRAPASAAREAPARAPGASASPPQPQRRLPQGPPSAVFLEHYSPAGGNREPRRTPPHPGRAPAPAPDADGIPWERQWGNARSPSPPLLPLGYYEGGYGARRSASPAPRASRGVGGIAGNSAPASRSVPPPRSRVAGGGGGGGVVSPPHAPPERTGPVTGGRYSPLRYLMSGGGAQAAYGLPHPHVAHNPYTGSYAGPAPSTPPAAYVAEAPRASPAAPPLPHMPWLPPSISGAAVSGHAALGVARPRAVVVSPPRRSQQHSSAATVAPFIASTATSAAAAPAWYPSRAGAGNTPAAGVRRPGKAAAPLEPATELDAEEAALKASAYNAVAAFAASQAAAARHFEDAALSPPPRGASAPPAPSVSTTGSSLVSTGGSASSLPSAVSPQPVRLLMGPPPPVSQIKSLEELIAFYAPPGVLGAPEEPALVLPPPLPPPAVPGGTRSKSHVSEPLLSAGVGIPRRASLGPQPAMPITPVPSSSASLAGSPALSEGEVVVSGSSAKGGELTPSRRQRGSSSGASSASSPPSLVTAPDEEDEDERLMRAAIISGGDDFAVPAAQPLPSAPVPTAPAAPNTTTAQRRGSQVSFSEWLAAATASGSVSGQPLLSPVAAAAPAPALSQPASFLQPPGLPPPLYAVPAPWSRSAAAAPPPLPAAPPQAIALAAALGIALPPQAGFNAASSGFGGVGGHGSATGLAAPSRPAPRLASSTASRAASAGRAVSAGRGAAASRAASAIRGASASGYGLPVPPPAVALPPSVTSSSALGRRLPWEPKYPGLHL